MNIDIVENLSIYRGFAIHKNDIEATFNGETEFAFTDVANTIVRDSIVAILKNKEEETSDILNVDLKFDDNNFLQRYLNTEVIVKQEDGTEVRGILLNISDTGLTLLTDGKKMFITKFISIRSVQEAKDINPTIVAQLPSPLVGSYELIIAYMLNGMNWNALYTVLVDENEDVMKNFKARATITNGTDMNFHANVTLVAGTPNVEPQLDQPQAFELRAEGASLQLPVAQPSFDYQTYHLTQTVDIPSKKSIDVPIIFAKNVPIEKFYAQQIRGTSGRGNLDFGIEFSNTKRNKLGIPLPAGKLTVYGIEGQDLGPFLGERSLPNSSEGDIISLLLGKSIFVSGRYTVTRQRLPTSSEGLRPVETQIVTITSTLNNALSAPVQVRIMFPVFSAVYNVDRTEPEVEFKRVDDMLEFYVDVDARSSEQVELVISITE